MAEWHRPYFYASKITGNEIIRKSRFATWCDKTAFVMLSAQISSMVLFTNGNAAPIAGANSSCLPN